MAASTTAVRAGRAFVELYGDDHKLRRTLRNVSRRLKAFGASVAGLGRRMMGMGAMILAPLVMATKLFSSMGDNLDKMSARTGVSVEALSEMGFAAEQSGANLETLEKGIKTMQRSVHDAGRGLSTQKDALADLGLVYADLKKLSPEEQFKLMADRISRVKDSTKQAALAMMLFGRAGQQLLPMLKGGARGIEKFQAEARKLGKSVSTEDAKAAAEFGDQMNRVWSVLKGIVFEVGKVLAPVFENWGQTIMDNVTAVRQFVKEHKGLIQTLLKVAAAVTGVGIVLIPLGLAISFLAAHPILGLIGVIGALILAFSGAGKSAKELNRELVAMHDKTLSNVQADNDRIKRLQELNQVQDKSKGQLLEMKQLVEVLETRWGSLGAQWDIAGKKLENLTEMQRNMNKLIREVDISRAKAKIAELRAEFAEAAEATWEHPLTMLGAKTPAEKMGFASEEILDVETILKGLSAQINITKQIEAQVRAAVAKHNLAVKTLALEQLNLKQLEEGRQKAPAPEPGEPIDGLGAMNRDLDERLHRLRAQNIEDEHERQIALIRLRYRKELDEAKGNTQQYLKLLTARGLEEQAIHKRFAKQTVEEDQRRAKEAAEAKADLDYDIQRLQIERDKKGTGQARALLDLDEKREKQAAVGEGRSKAYLEGVGKKYNLKRGLLDASAEMPQRTVQVKGTFSAAAAARMGAGGPSDKILKVNEKIANNTKELLAQARRARLVFT